MLAFNIKLIITRFLYIGMFVILAIVYHSLDSKLKSCEKEKNLIALVISFIFLAFILSVI